MANQIHQHPDGTVSVRVDDKIYTDTEKNFKKDFGINLQKVPAGFDERLYEQGVRHALSARSSVIDGGPMPWTIGDNAIGKFDDALANQQQRLNDDKEKDRKRVIDEDDKLKKDAKDNVDRINAQLEAQIAEDAVRRDAKHQKDGDDFVIAGRKKMEDDEKERKKHLPKPPPDHPKLPPPKPPE
jgi:hypothetical protein